jgi:hypothetical protein
MQKPSGISLERRKTFDLSSIATFVRWPKTGRVLTTGVLGLLLGASACGQQVGALGPVDSDKEPVSKAVQPLPAPSLDLSKVIDLDIDYSFLARENVPNSQSAYGRIGEQQIGVRANLSVPVNAQLSLSIGGFYIL